MQKPFQREGRAVQKEKLHWDQFQAVPWVFLWALRDTANIFTPAKGFLCSTCFIPWRTDQYFLFFSIKTQNSLLNTVSAQEKKKQQEQIPTHRCS